MLHRLTSAPDTEFRLARVFYYLGMAFVAAGAVRPVPNLDLSDCFFLISMTVVVGRLALTGGGVNPAIPELFLFGFIVLCVGATFSLPVALHPLDAAGALARFTYTTVVWFALGAVVLRNRRHVEIAMAVWIVSIAMSGLAAITQVLSGADVFASFTTIPTASASGLPITFVGRQIGLSAHPNDLGGAAAVVIAPAIFFATSSAWRKTKRLVFMGLLGLVIACIALSGSVTAFGAGLAGAAVALASARIPVRHVIAVATVLSLTALALVFINQTGSSSVIPPLDRISQTLDLTNASLATGLQRLDLDAIAWDEVLGNPLYGVGLDSLSNAEVLGGIGVHNMFLFAWVGAGIFGFLGLLTMVAAICASYVAAFRYSVLREERSLVLTLGTSFLTFLIVGLAQPVLFVRYGWVPAALFMPLRALHQRRERALRTELATNQTSALELRI